MRAASVLMLVLLSGCSSAGHDATDATTNPWPYFFPYSQSWQATGAAEGHNWTANVVGATKVEVVVSYHGTAPTLQSGDRVGTLSIIISADNGTETQATRFDYDCPPPESTWGCMSQDAGPLVAPATPGEYNVVLGTATLCAGACDVKLVHVEVTTQDSVGIFTVDVQRVDQGSGASVTGRVADRPA